MKVKQFKSFGLPLLIFIFSLLGNYWIWSFWSKNKYWEFLLMIGISCLLVLFNARKGPAKFLLLFLPLLVILLKPGSKTIFYLNDLDIYSVNQRRSYYQNPLLGRFFENKLNRYVFNYEKNLFEGIDINYYFFATHPRERLGVDEIKKFPELVLPLFLIGLYFSLKRKQLLSIFYFLSSLLIAAFFSPIDTFSFFFFPFLVINIYFGIKECLIFFISTRRKPSPLTDELDK
ncbi:MAG TPA: hypothetical protein VMW25_00710 [Clostridia bacterium]|nr:hypothetical protein [Clostridia bacterium]